MPLAAQLSPEFFPIPRRFRAPGPTPRARPPGIVRLLAALRTNTLTIWARQHFEEKISTASILSGPYAVVNDPDSIRRILLENTANYRKSAAQRRILAPIGDGLLTAEGSEWRRQRRVLAPIFTPKTIASFIPAAEDAAEALLDRWRGRGDGNVDLCEEMSLASVDVLDRALFSRGLERHLKAFGENVACYFDSVGRGDPLDMLDAPSWLPRLGQRRAQRAKRFFEAAVDEILGERRRLLAARPGSAPRDLLTLLIEAVDPESGHGLSEADVRANVIIFIGAGFETTANAMTWSLFLLASQPEIRAALENEAERELGARPLSAAAVERLVATRAVVEEAMRLYPPLGVITRVAIEADNLAGVAIRPGTTLIMAPWVLHRHRLLWDDPDHFQPWRFLPQRRASIHRFAYLPFGAGPRTCIAANFALQNTVILLASILRSYRVEIVAKQPVTPVQRFSMRPKGGLPVRLRPRC